jgi:outer membrane lipoprotein carrier protein
MKKFLFAALAALLVSGATVQAQDAKAKGIIEAASKKMGSLKTLKSGFTLKLIGKSGKAQDTKKGVFLMKGQKYRITIPGQEIISDGRTVWTYMKDANEVQVSNNNPSEQAMSPTKLFTNFYDKEYNYKYVGTRKVAGKPCDIIELLPKAASTQFGRVELAIDKSGAIAGGNIFEKNGNQYQYEVSGFVANAPMGDNLFAFDSKTHPKVEVIDLR